MGLFDRFRKKKTPLSEDTSDYMVHEIRRYYEQFFREVDESNDALMQVHAFNILATANEAVLLENEHASPMDMICGVVVVASMAGADKERASAWGPLLMSVMEATVQDPDRIVRLRAQGEALLMERAPLLEEDESLKDIDLADKEAVLDRVKRDYQEKIEAAVTKAERERLARLRDRALGDLSVLHRDYLRRQGES